MSAEYYSVMNIVVRGASEGLNDDGAGQRCGARYAGKGEDR